MASAREDVYCTVPVHTAIIEAHVLTDIIKLLMSDSYLPGAAVLAHSLRDCGTSKKLAVLVTLDSLLRSTIIELESLYDYILPVEKLANPNLENLHRLNRLDLRFAFTKLVLWRQTQFRKIVYIDADVVALRAPDELFSLPATFAVAPDIGWPDCFNSGVMLLTPNMSDYWALQTLASSGTSFDGADQGLLNQYFANGKRETISFTYNCTPSAGYQYEPAYRHFGSGISLVHFIGREKPWGTGRAGMENGGQRVYTELLGRWWAVYERHYRISQSSGQGQSGLRTVQRHVKGEHSWTSRDDAISGYTSMVSSAQPMTDPSKRLWKVDQGLVEPILTAEQRRLSASHMDWDATKCEPPLQSKPEAVNFPILHYEMSRDAGLFHAPRSYPEPPKDMYYQVPQIKPAVYDKPRPIFPWEQTSRKPTRVFDGDPPLPSDLGVQSTLTSAPSSTLDEAPDIPATSPTPPLETLNTESWEHNSRKNAWDEVPAIDHYVRQLKQSQDRRGKLQVLHNTVATPDFAVRGIPSKRRESLILTDFPTEIERPSLPVTPAPIRRPTYWGVERGGVEEMPEAEGVVEQSEWNPMEKLEELRRFSLIAPEDLPLLPNKELPLRGMPRSSTTLFEPLSPTQGHERIFLSNLDLARGVVPAAGAQAPPPITTTVKEPDFQYGNSKADKQEKLWKGDSELTEYSIA